MKVRVFIYTGDEGEEYSGEDFEFETMPQVGQMLTFTGPEGGHDEIDRVGFIQEDDTFVAAVWMKPKPSYQLHVV